MCIGFQCPCVGWELQKECGKFLSGKEIFDIVRNPVVPCPNFWLELIKHLFSFLSMHSQIIVKLKLEF